MRGVVTCSRGISLHAARQKDRFSPAFLGAAVDEHFVHAKGGGRARDTVAATGRSSLWLIPLAN